jgi:ABC-type uncharacterized transport system substrate-binding protein
MTIGRSLTGTALLACLGAAMAQPALAHPHVFAEARLEVDVTADSAIKALRNVWRFDDLFTSTVMLEFDSNGNGEMETGEIDELTAVITDSISDYNYFLNLTADGTEFGFKQVKDMAALFDDGQMIIIFSAVPESRVAIADEPVLSVYDPTFYTSIEFYDESEMVMTNAPQGCSHDMVVPDIDAILTEQQDTLTESFFNDPEGNDYSKMFATRMEISCTDT